MPCMRRDPVGSSGAMSLTSKSRNRSRIRRGRAKQGIGRVTRSQRLQAEGLADRVGGGVRQFGERIFHVLLVSPIQGQGW